MEIRVNSTKLFDPDNLETQIKKAMKRFNKVKGHFEIGLEYEINGMIKLILN